MYIIGITGGVGAGKSTVLDYLESQYDAYTVQADQTAHELMEPEDAGYFSEGSDIRAGEDAPAVPELAGHELLLGLMDTADKLYDNYAALIELARRQLRRCEQ